MTRKAKLGVAGAVAAAMIGILAVLTAFLIAELALIYQKYGLAATQRIREGHEKERELLKIYYTEYHPLIAAALGQARGNASTVSSTSGSGFYTLIVGHGYPIGLKYALLVDKESRAVKESKPLDMVVEPPCTIIKAMDIGFNKTGNETVSFISSNGRIYQALDEPPNMAEVIPCVSGNGNDGNSFDLKVEITPPQALNQVSVEIIVGACSYQQTPGGNQIRLDDCPPFTVVQLTATDSDEYSFRYWQVEGKKYDSKELYVLLDEDFNIIAKFDIVGGGGG